MSIWINSLGLLIDIAGALLLWKFGLPEDVNREGLSFLAIEETDEQERVKARKYDSYSRLALLFLIIGFILQLVSNFMT